MGKRTLTMLCGLALASLAVADGRRPGSVLVFPAHRANANGFSIISVTNTHTTPMTPISLGGSTNVHFKYFNTTQDLARPTRATSCGVFNRVEFLSPADTLSVLTLCHNPVPGQGYLFVTAEDPSLFRTAWSHNELIGSTIHLTNGGASFMVPAIPFEAVTPAGTTTDLDFDGRPDFNGLEYEKPPDYLMLDTFIAAGGAELVLVNLADDPFEENELYLSVWNDNELALSVTVNFNCWFNLPLEFLSPLFSHSFLSTLPHDPAETDVNCDGVGDLYVGWIKLQSIGRRQGQTRVGADGAFIGQLIAGAISPLAYGRPLWESKQRQP